MHRNNYGYILESRVLGARQRAKEIENLYGGEEVGWYTSISPTSATVPEHRWTLVGRWIMELAFGNSCHLWEDR